MDRISLGDLIIQGGSLDSKVEEIIEEATNTGNLVGKSLWNALVFSGVQLGIDAVKAHFSGFGNAQLNYIRHIIKIINNRLPDVTGDDETFKALSDVKAELTKSLRDHCKSITDTHIETMKTLYAIPEKYITATDPVESIGSRELQRVGFFAMNKAPVYFFGWELADRENELVNLKCHCSDCLIKRLPGPVPAATTIGNAIDRLGGLDILQAKYGAFLIEQAREGLTRMLEGVDDIHGTSYEKEAEAIMAEAMKSLKHGQGDEND